MGLEDCRLLHPHLLCMSGHTTYVHCHVCSLNIIILRVGPLAMSRSPRTSNLRCQTPNIVRPIVTRALVPGILINYSAHKRLRFGRGYGVPLLELHRDECYSQLAPRKGL